MSGNYCAFYVAEPFHEGALGAHATKDFVYYNTLRMWKGADSGFPFLPVSPVNGGSLYLTWSPTSVESLRIAFSLAYSKVTFLSG